MKELKLKYRNEIKKRNLFRAKPATMLENQIVGFHLPKDIRKSILATKLIDGKGLQNVNRLNIVTTTNKNNEEEAKGQLLNLSNQWGINLISQFVKEPCLSLESYTSLGAYLPKKTLNVIVEMISGKKEMNTL